jgi:CRISPR-associated protein Csx17
MTELALPACRTRPLGSYLASLGLLRAVTRLLDDEATGGWQAQRFVLGSRFSTVDSLVDTLHTHFEPEAIVSPWNAGSGFAGNGRGVAAEAAVQWVRDSTDDRLTALREAVRAADTVVARGRARGWGGHGTDLWDTRRKNDVLRLCRNEFSDQALAWLDAVVALGQDADPAYSRLLGTGGNLGRQDLSSTYLQHVRSVLTDRRSRAWLLAALAGREPVSLPRETLGQYDPGTVGSPEDPNALGNPWVFLLLIEGTMLFATAVVRRHGAAYGRTAVPFQVRGSTAGFSSSAADESVLAELWAPEWTVQSRLTEVAHLLGEGRAEWNSRPVRSGFDFARAVASLGVDRGIEAFGRHVFVERLGQAPIAIPVERIEVHERRGVALLSGVDGWLEGLRRAKPPGAIPTRLRELEQAVFDHARTGAASELAAVFAALGRCHEAVARSGAARASVSPLVLGHGRELLNELWPAVAGDVELRVALALATARDEPALPTMGGLRTLLAPVAGTAPRDRKPRWSTRPVTASLPVDLPEALAEATRRRGFPGAVREVPGRADVAERGEAAAADAAGKDAAGKDAEAAPAVRGVRIAFDRGRRLGTADVYSFVAGTLDERRIADLLAGLLTVDWRGTADGAPPGADAVPHPAVDLLLPFTSASTLRVPTEDDPRRQASLRPGADWPVLLAADRVGEVLSDAARRLRIAGLRQVIAPTGADLDGRRLAPAPSPRPGPRSGTPPRRRRA